MADKKISQLSSATTPLAGTEVLPIVQSGSTVKVSAADVTAGRAVSASSLTLTGSPLAATSGGTGQSSAFTANGVAYASSTSALATGSALAFDGTTFSAGTSTFKVDTSSNRVLVNLAAAIQGDSLEVLSKGNAGTISLFGRASDNGSTIAFRSNGANTQKAAVFASDTGLGFATGTTTCGNFDTSGNLTLNTGNLVVGTAAKGIDFSANTGAAGETSSLLNWYETGTFTPVLSCATPGTLAVTYSVQKGYYTRVGRVVHIWGNIQTSAVTVGTATGAVRLTGLPFTSAASSTAVETYMGSMGYQGITKAGYTDFNPQLQENTTYVLILASKSDGGAAANVQIGDLSTGTNLLYWQVTYVAA